VRISASSRHHDDVLFGAFRTAGHLFEGGFFDAKEDFSGEDKDKFNPIIPEPPLGPASKPTETDVMKPRKFGNAMQIMSDFRAHTRLVDVTRTYSDNGSATSNVLMTYYSSE
jgi:hypothetical protein